MEKERREVFASTSFKIAVLVLMALCFAVIALQYREKRRLQDWVSARVESEAVQYTVDVDGHTLPDPSAFLGALRRADYVSAHHSSPINPSRVTIKSAAGTWELVVARDSKSASELWVYLPPGDEPIARRSKGRLVGQLNAPGVKW